MKLALPGAPYGLLGPAGAGKSRLLRTWAAGWEGAALVDLQGLAGPLPPVVLLDEPPAGREELRMIRALGRERSLVVATRSIGLVRELCRSVGLVWEGRLMAEGAAADLLPIAGYEVRVRGRLEAHWADWFEGAPLASENGETRLCLGQPDQAALHGVLIKVRDLGLPVIAVTPLWPELHQIINALGGERQC